VREKSLQWALAGKIGQTDEDLAIYALGSMSAMAQDWTNAEKHFNALFASDSFIAPEAGLQLAACQRAQGENTQAEATLKAGVAKFPAYAPFVVSAAQAKEK